MIPNPEELKKMDKFDYVKIKSFVSKITPSEVKSLIFLKHKEFEKSQRTKKPYRKNWQKYPNNL